MGERVADFNVSVDRDLFFRKMIRSFAKSLEQTVGLEETAGYVALVGSEVGSWLEDAYKSSSGRDRFDPQEVAELLVDLKNKIGGDFSIISVTPTEIVLGNGRCPFGELAKGRPSLCRMTSNVFGRITANQLGYARVELEDTIAGGSDHCRVTISLTPEGDEAVDHEFFRVEERLL